MSGIEIETERHRLEQERLRRRAGIDLALMVLKAVLIANGAAVVALLAFSAILYGSAETAAAGARVVVMAQIDSFLVGFILGLVAALLGFVAEALLAPLGNRLAAALTRLAAALAAVVAVIYFADGVLGMADALVVL